MSARRIWREHPFPSIGSAFGYATDTFIQGSVAGLLDYPQASPYWRSDQSVLTMSLDMNELGSPSTDESDSGAANQSKTLVANMYSSRGIQDPDSYKELDDWSMSDDDISLSYQVTKAGGLVRNALKSLSASGNHEEWYADMQIALAHRIAELKGQDELPDGRDVEGAVPVMEQVSIGADEVMDFLREHPEEISDLDTSELAELREAAEDDDQDAAQAEADD